MILTHLKKLFIFFILLIVLNLSGCKLNSNKNEKKLEINDKFHINENIFLLYKGIDQDGCKYFLPYSKNKKVINVIYYINKNKKFTINKMESDCKNN